MKKVYLSLGFCLFIFALQAQVAINENGNDPNTSAMLDISSTDKGLLIPRMDSTARKNIISPADGLLVYDNSTATYWFYDNNKWNEIRNGSTAISYLDFADSLPDDDLDLSCSKEVEELTLSRDVDDAFVAGNFLYAIDEETPDSLYIYNIHDPLVPTFVAGTALSPNPLEILIAGRYAYIIHNEEEDNFTVLDISDSNNPTEIANITVGLRPNEIDIAGDYAYIVDGNGDLIFVNIGNPASPIVENSFSVDFRSAADVVAKNNYAYVLSNTTREKDIKVIDVSDVANPIAIDTLDLGSSPRELKVVDNYAYVIDFSDQELVIIDVSDSSNLTVVSNTPLGASPREIRIANGYAFVATGNITGEFKMIDISDPLNPIIESDLSATAAASSVNIFGGYAYISGNSNNLSIVSIMPCDPFYVGVNGFSGDLFVVSENDNLGNHIATENIQLSNFYLSNDGDDEGIAIDDNGKVSIDSLNIANAYTLPTVDGITNQVLTTDGSGNLSWNTNNGAFNSGNGLTFSLNN
ncbi:MAG: hypothetical protein AAF599_08900, partial [Bacteroidota bacterium]